MWCQFFIEGGWGGFEWGLMGWAWGWVVFSGVLKPCCSGSAARHMARGEASAGFALWGWSEVEGPFCWYVWFSPFSGSFSSCFLLSHSFRASFGFFFLGTSLGGPSFAWGSAAGRGDQQNGADHFGRGAGAAALGRAGPLRALRPRPGGRATSGASGGVSGKSAAGWIEASCRSSLRKVRQTPMQEVDSGLQL